MFKFVASIENVDHYVCSSDGFLIAEALMRGPSYVQNFLASEPEIVEVAASLVIDQYVFAHAETAPSMPAVLPKITRKIPVIELDIEEDEATAKRPRVDRVVAA